MYAIRSYYVEKDIASVLAYEEKDHFRCFDLEVNPSISANIHILDGLKHAGLGRSNSSMEKIFQFLAKAKGSAPFWVDKWHASSYNFV